MSVADVRTLYEYGWWANERLFAVLGQLPPDDFTRDVAGSYGSIRSTLVHAMSAEWGWLDRCGGAKRGPALVADDYPTVAALAARWHEVAGHVRAFLDTLSDADLARPITFAIGNGPAGTRPLGHLLRHAAVHGVHHRGQVSLLIRALGHAPGNFDLLFFEGGA